MEIAFAFLEPVCGIKAITIRENFESEI